jgi:hypothetical protein
VGLIANMQSNVSYIDIGCGMGRGGRGLDEPITNFIINIKEDTTIDAFNKEYEKVILSEPHYRLNAGARACCCIYSEEGYLKKTFQFETALHVAARVGNIALIAHIVENWGAHLLDRSDSDHNIPLFSTTFCKDLNKGLLAAKKLIYLGAPIETEVLSGNLKAEPKTLFSEALKNGSTKIAAFCLRSGFEYKPKGEPKAKCLQTLEDAKKLIIFENNNAALFKLGLEKDSGTTLLALPADVSKYLLSVIAAKLV